MNKAEIQTPPELRPMEAALDALAQSERAAASATLEDRIFVATRADLAGVERPLTITVRRRTLSRLRVAAAIALVAGVGAVWLAGQSGKHAKPGTTLASLDGLESEVDFLLAMRSPDEGLRPASDSIDALFLETLNLGNSLKSGSGAPLPDEGSL